VRTSLRADGLPAVWPGLMNIQRLRCV